MAESSSSFKNSSLVLVLLGIIAVFVLGVILRELRTVLLPFVIAVFLSNIFKPVVTYLRQKRTPTGLSLLVVLLAFMSIVSLLAILVYSSIGAFAQEFPKYEAKFEGVFEGLYLQFETFAAGQGIQLADMDWRSAVPFDSMTTLLTSGIGSFLSFLTNTFLVLLFMMFILAGSGDLSAKMEKGFTADQANRIGGIIQNIDQQVRQYLITKTLVSAGTGALTFVILWLIGVDFPLVWGFLAFLFNFIPNVGSAIAVLFPLVLSFLQFDSLLQPALVGIFLGGTQMVMGNVVEPRLMAFSLNLSALFVLVSLILWGWLWGIWGMVLAVPMTAIIKIVFENIEPLRPLSVLMGGPIGVTAAPIVTTEAG